MRKKRISNYKETLEQLRELSWEMNPDTDERAKLEDIIDKLEPKQPKIKLLGNHAPLQVCPVCGQPVYYVGGSGFDGYEFHDDMCFCGIVIDWSGEL